MTLPDPSLALRCMPVMQAIASATDARRALIAWAIGAAGLALTASGCHLDAEGKPLGSTELYYPTGLVISEGATTLYVANSDFDLQYASGNVQAVDTAALRAALRPLALGLARGDGAASACADAGLAGNPNPFLNPGPCAPIPYGGFVRASVFVGAFASGLMLSYDPDTAGARLFAPVRGDPSITYFDIDDDRESLTTGSSAPAGYRLDCRAAASGFCDDAHRIGRDADRTQRGLLLPPDPVGIAASGDGEAIVSAHQSQAAASLVVNPWGSTPFLSYYAANLAPGPTEVANIPRAAFVAGAAASAAESGVSFIYRDAFVVSYRSAPQVDVMQYVRDAGSVPSRPFLVRAQQVPITTSASNSDHRGVAILGTERAACEATCAATTDELACLAVCAETIPLRVFVASRNPESLLLGRIETFVFRSTVLVGGVATKRITAAFDSLVFYGALPLDFGASRVEVGRILDRDGTPVDRIFAVAFDSRRVFIIDPVRERIETVVRTGRGPHDIAIDQGTDDGESYSYLYVGHFTDSYIGVVSLDQRRALTYGNMIASVGVPVPPIDTL